MRASKLDTGLVSVNTAVVVAGIFSHAPVYLPIELVQWYVIRQLVIASTTHCGEFRAAYVPAAFDFLVQLVHRQDRVDVNRLAKMEVGPANSNVM